MGRRSRSRERNAATGSPSRKGASASASGRPQIRGSGVKRVVGIYAGLTILLAVLVLAGIALLGTTLGSVIVIAFAVLGAGLLSFWFRGRAATLAFSDEDRMLQTVANGLLIMAVGFSIISAVVAAVA